MQLEGNPYEYIDEILEDRPKRVSREGKRTYTYWSDDDIPEDSFLPHPDARQSILYKPRSTK